MASDDRRISGLMCCVIDDTTKPVSSSRFHTGASLTHEGTLPTRTRKLFYLHRRKIVFIMATVRNWVNANLYHTPVRVRS